MSWHLFHRWSKWEQEVMQTRTIPYELRLQPELAAKVEWVPCQMQHRSCSDCGKKQVRRVW